jgi:hypothetical protein
VGGVDIILNVPTPTTTKRRYLALSSASGRVGVMGLLMSWAMVKCVVTYILSYRKLAADNYSALLDRHAVDDYYPKGLRLNLDIAYARVIDTTEYLYAAK